MKSRKKHSAALNDYREGLRSGYIPIAPQHSGGKARGIRDTLSSMSDELFRRGAEGPGFSDELYEQLGWIGTDGSLEVAVVSEMDSNT